MVIRYRYLWKTERESGIRVGEKHRPCVVLFVKEMPREKYRVGVCPISTAYQDQACVDLPEDTVKRLNLRRDKESQIICTEINNFTWPDDDDLVEVPAGGFFYGPLPSNLRKTVFAALRLADTQGNVAQIQR